MRVPDLERDEISPDPGPVRWSSEGLLLAAPLVRRHFDEAALLSVAAAVEEIGGAATADSSP